LNNLVDLVSGFKHEKLDEACDSPLKLGSGFFQDLAALALELINKHPQLFVELGMRVSSSDLGLDIFVDLLKLALPLPHAFDVLSECLPHHLHLVLAEHLKLAFPEQLAQVVL